MNERIKELAEEAGWDNHHSKFDTRIEKFAELIVRECAGVVEKNLFESIGWNTSKKVKQHFGVEE
jgi:predicted nucleotidyltransferase